MFEKNPTSPIECFQIGGYYDQPLNGWIRTKGAYYKFEIIQDFMRFPAYLVYHVDKSVRISHLLRFREFRRDVGWHMTRYPGRPRTWFNKSHEDVSFKSFYALEPLPIIEDSQKKLVGITDLKSEVCWFYELKEYDKNWVFVEYEDEE